MTDASATTRRLKILITEGSSISARQALYDLGPEHTIDILDPAVLCQCRFSRFVRRWYRSPSFTADPCGYLQFLGERLRAESYDVVLPLHDEVYLLSRVRDSLADLAAVAIPEFTAVERLQSKLAFFNLAKELKLPQPVTEVLTSESEIARWGDYPQYCKLDYGTAGQTVRLVRDRAELEKAVAEFKHHGWWTDGTPILLQRPATGLQGFVRAIFSHGKLMAHHATVLRMRGVGGSAVAKVGVRHDEVAEHMERLGERLGWHGALFCDYFYDESTGQPQYIEANPRIGDSANAAFSGVNLCQRWVDVALGRPSEPTMSRPAIRSHAGILILMSKALEGAGRRELWTELHDQRRGQGIYEESREEMTRRGEDWLSAVPFAWIAGRLLVNPGAAQRVVRTTVANYALHAEAAQRIAQMPLDTLVASLAGRRSADNPSAVAHPERV